MSKRRSNLAASDKISQLSQSKIRQPKKIVLDSDVERGLYVLFAKDTMLEKGKEPFVRFSEMKKIKFKGDRAPGFLDKELTQPLRKRDCFVGREIYYWLGYTEHPHDDFPKESEMDSFMRYRLATIIRFVDPDEPIETKEIKTESDAEETIEEIKTELNAEEMMEEDSATDKSNGLIAPSEEIVTVRTRDTAGLRPKNPHLTPEQMEFLINHLNFDKKLVQAEGGQYILQAMRWAVERKQDQLRKTEKQSMIFENLTINDENGN